MIGFIISQHGRRKSEDKSDVFFMIAGKDGGYLTFYGN